MKKRWMVSLVTMIAVVTANAQAMMRNCRPQLAEKGVPEYVSATRYIPAILSTETQGTNRSNANNPYVGDRRQLVILAAFADQSFKGDRTQTLGQWNKILNTKNFNEAPFHGSLHDYFYDQSYGQLRLGFDLHYTVVGNMKKYRSTSWDDENSKYLVQDVIEAIRNEVADWSPYDWNGDGYVDQVLIIYAGKGQNDGGNSNTIWPHQWWLSKHNNCQPISVSSGGKKYNIDSYCCVQEVKNNGDYGTFGTICHEYSHCFGLNDLYYNMTPYVYDWDLMDHGNYNGGGFRPCGYSAFERIFMGWMNPTELTTEASITSMPALTEKPTAYLVRNDGESKEYYLVENRQKEGWDTGLPGSGIIVVHVDYNEKAFIQELPNTPNLQRYTIFPANNKKIVILLNTPGWGYPYNGNDQLTNTSEPAATLNNVNADGTRLMSKPITNMSVKNGLASFCFMEGAVTAIPAAPAEAEEQDDEWYTLDGRRLSGTPQAKGLYIRRYANGQQSRISFKTN